MCTVIAARAGGLYFGRNMDIEGHFGERVVVVPRGYPFRFRMTADLSTHHAIIGMAAVRDGYPLFADACNEHGLCMAGLHFPDNAVYEKAPMPNKLNLSPFELIPWVLGACKTANEAWTALDGLRLVDLPFRDDLPNTPLHWIVADATRAFVLEYTEAGAFLCDDPVGVLTNNPPFRFHLQNLTRYGNLSNRAAEGDLAKALGLKAFGAGLMANGLPGDYSSPSRFVKAAWLLSLAPPWQMQEDAVMHTFRLLSAVAPPWGSVLTPSGKAHYTLYSCVIDAARCEYFYQTYFSREVKSISLGALQADGRDLLSFPIEQADAVMQD